MLQRCLQSMNVDETVPIRSAPANEVPRGQSLQRSRRTLAGDHCHDRPPQHRLHVHIGDVVDRGQFCGIFSTGRTSLVLEPSIATAVTSAGSLAWDQ